MLDRHADPTYGELARIRGSEASDLLFNPKPPVPDEEFSKDFDSFKDQTTNLGFFTWFGVIAIVVILGLVVWKLLT